MSNNSETTTVEKKNHDEGLPFYPLHLMKEMMVMLCGIAFVLSLAALFPAHLMGPADPFSTPAHIKPEWYFLSVYQLLKYVPQGTMFGNFTYLNLAVIFQGVAVFGLICVPFIDKSPGKKASRRPVFTAVGLAVVILLVVMTYLGHFSGHEDPIFHHVFH